MTHYESTVEEDDFVTAPPHYAGNGEIECKHAMESMHAGYDGHVGITTAYWATCALKYLWRFPRKNKVQDLDKAMECLRNAKAAYMQELMS